MVSSGRRPDKKSGYKPPPRRITCFWDKENDVDVRVAREWYVPTNVICRECRGCQK